MLTFLGTWLRRPAYVSLSVLCLAIGASAAAIVFLFLDALIIHPPAEVISPRQLVDIDVSSFPDFTEVSSATQTLSSVAASSRVTVTLVRNGHATSAQGLLVTASYFPTLGTRPLLGRFWARADEYPGGPLLVVLSYSSWRRLFGGDPSVIGSQIDVGGRSATLIGVAPRDFSGLDNNRIDAFLPIPSGATMLAPRSDLLTNPNAHWLTVVGRLRPSVSLREARSEIRRILAHRSDVAKPSSGEGGGPLVTSLLDDRRQRVASRSLVGWLALLSAAVMVIACVNVATLNFTSVLARRDEFWVRRVLGAGPWRLVVNLAREAIALGFIAAPVAAVFAFWAASAIATVMNDLAPSGTWAPSTHTLALTISASVAMALMCGAQGFVEVSLQCHGLSQNKSLTRTSMPLLRSSLRRVLLSAQIAALVSVLAWAVSFATGLRRASAQPWGIDLDRLLIVTPSAEPLRGAGTPSVSPRVLATLRDAPDIARFSVASSVPLYSVTFLPIFARPSDGFGGDQRRAVEFTAVDSSYFATVGQRLLEGRVFGEETAGSNPVAVISRELAQQLSPNPLGKCLRLLTDRASCRTVIGVVEGTREAAIGSAAIAPQVYIPLNQTPIPINPVIVARARGSTSEAVAHLRLATTSLGVTDVRAATSLLEPQIMPLRIGSAACWVVSSIGLLLTVVGLFGSVGFNVKQREREFAIRSALGATVRELTRQLLSDLALIVMAGLVGGTVIAFAGQHLLTHWVVGLRPFSWATILAILIFVSGIATLSALEPALRVRAVDTSKILHT